MEHCDPLILLQNEIIEKNKYNEWYKHRMSILAPYLNLEWEQLMSFCKETDWFLYKNALYIAMYSKILYHNYNRWCNFPLDNYYTLLKLLENTLCYYENDYIKTGQDTLHFLNSLK